jgi:Sigma-70 region 2
VAQDEPREADNAGERVPIPEAERRERLTQLVLCRTKLSASEALLLREVFPAILVSHHDQVWNWVRRRALLDHEAEDLLQEAFFALHNHLLEHPGSRRSRSLRPPRADRRQPTPVSSAPMMPV